MLLPSFLEADGFSLNHTHFCISGRHRMQKSSSLMKFDQIKRTKIPNNFDLLIHNVILLLQIT